MRTQLKNAYALLTRLHDTNRRSVPTHRDYVETAVICAVLIVILRYLATIPLLCMKSQDKVMVLPARALAKSCRVTGFLRWAEAAANRTLQLSSCGYRPVGCNDRRSE